MLENLLEHHNRFSFDAIQQQTGIGCPIGCVAIQNRLNIPLVGIAFLQNDVKSFFCVEALLLGGIVPGKLVLVEPFELKGYGFRVFSRG